MFLAVATNSIKTYQIWIGPVIKLNANKNWFHTWNTATANMNGVMLFQWIEHFPLLLMYLRRITIWKPIETDLSHIICNRHQNVCHSALFFRGNSNERQFLRDFVGAVPGSSGERLACWLQPDSRLDPNKCELKAISEPVRFGWPTQLTVITRDQYGDIVYVPNLKVTLSNLFNLRNF